MTRLLAAGRGLADLGGKAFLIKLRKNLCNQFNPCLKNGADHAIFTQIKTAQ